MTTSSVKNKTLDVAWHAVRHFNMPELIACCNRELRVSMTTANNMGERIHLG
jgi:hypothetical protein